MQDEVVVERIELAGISGYKLQPAHASGSVDREMQKPALDVQIVFSQPEDSNEIVGLVTAALDSPQAAMKVVYTMFFSGFNAVWEEVGEEQKRELAGNVAMPAVLPYIRERFESLSASLGVSQVVWPRFSSDDLAEIHPVGD